MPSRVALAGSLAEPNRTLLADAFAAHGIAYTYHAAGEPISCSDIEALVTFSPTSPPQPFDSMDVSLFERELDFALHERFSASQQAIAAFDSKKGGAIIHVVPAEGIWGMAANAAQSSATMAAVALSRSIALDHHDRAITSNVVALDGEYEPAELAALLIYLTQGTGRAMTGQVLGLGLNTIYAYNQPRPVLVAHRADGWNQAHLVDLIDQDWMAHPLTARKGKPA